MLFHNSYRLVLQFTQQGKRLIPDLQDCNLMKRNIEYWNTVPITYKSQ